MLKRRSTDTGQNAAVTDHTEGSIIKSIINMGFPSMIGFGLGNLYDLVDAFWLSRLGTEPVAAVTILGPLLWVVGSANHIVGVGSVAVISRRYGEKDPAKTELAIKETLILKWTAAIVFGLIGFIVAPWMLQILGARGEVARQGTIYGRIIFAGLGFQFAAWTIFTALRSVANPQKAMFVMILMTVLNMVLDPFLIFGWWFFPRMGVAGAALASNISFAVAFLVGLAMFYSGKTNVRLHWRSPEKVRIGAMLKILVIGLPSAVGTLSFSVARLVIMPMVAVFGTGVVAAYGISQRITALGIMLLVGVGLGLSALIGHNLGARKLERAGETARQAIWLGVGIQSGLALVFLILPGPIMRLFFSDPEVVGYGVAMMRIFALSLPFLGVYQIIESVYTGAGENRPVMVFNVLQAWVLEIPAVLITTRVLGFDQNAVWWSITGATTGAALAFYLYFRRGQWLQVKV